MKYCLLSCIFLFICSQAAAANDPAHAPLVLLISVDGMKPEAVLDAQKHGLKVPNLRGFMTDGLYASGVRGVLPTLTYPSHTTLLTGASPAKHGIFDNTTFDPLLRNQARLVLVRRGHQGSDAVGCRRRGTPQDRERVLAGERGSQHHL